VIGHRGSKTRRPFFRTPSAPKFNNGHLRALAALTDARSDCLLTRFNPNLGLR
jgi:hypothetical protein